MCLLIYRNSKAEVIIFPEILFLIFFHLTIFIVGHKIQLNHVNMLVSFNLNISSEHIF